jgi:hypothetical protein
MTNMRTIRNRLPAWVLAGSWLALMGPLHVFSPAIDAAWAETQAGVFIEELGDVPLMPGLRLVEDKGVVFDAPAGRIVEAVAAGPVPAARVRAFYAQTLPQLGWRPVAGAYRRESEKLRLEVEEAAGGETVARFFLSPVK